MFRRFLKFLKGDEVGGDDRFEGSYLDHLLEQIRPGLVKQLDHCPEHDPLLLVVTGVLRTTMPGAWSTELREPLTDKHTPGVQPPPPPAEDVDDSLAVMLDDTFDGPAPKIATTDDATEEIDGPIDVEDDAVPVDETPEDSGNASTPDDEADQTDEREAPEAIVEVDESVSVEDDDVVEEAMRGGSARITEEIDVSELQAVVPPKTPDKDSTVEIERNALLKGALPRVDTPEVLQAGRVLLNLLVDNDRLPTDLQLSMSETTLARDLLLGYFVGNDDFEGKARKLLSIVEKKFSDGLFSQARLLLQLFHTDESTRITNDRNLFYEDMILRLGIRRRHKLTEEELLQLKERLKALNTDKGLREFCAWLDAKLLVKMHLLGQSADALELWKQTIARSSKPAAKEEFLRLIPSSRWRPVDRQEATVKDQIRGHIGPETARNFVVAQIRTCYFVLRAVGDTGLEGYLDCFFDWTKAEFGVNGTKLMPLLYNRSMMESASMNDILDDVYSEFFAAHVGSKVALLKPDQIDKAFTAAMEKVAAYDFGEVAPGYYDLGGFVMDELFGMKYPSREFAAKVHRIT